MSANREKNISQGIKRARKIRQSGAELVEVTLIIIPLLGLIFLLLDVSMVVFLRSTFQEAVREGVRYAITGSNTPGPCQDDSVKAVVKPYALGFLNAAGPAATLHVHFINPVSGAVADNSFGNIVEVSVEGYTYGPLAPFERLGMKAQIWARAYDIMEAIPGALPCITTKE